MLMLLILFFQWYLDDKKWVKIEKRNYVVKSILLITGSETLYVKIGLRRIQTTLQ